MIRLWPEEKNHDVTSHEKHQQDAALFWHFHRSLSPEDDGKSTSSRMIHTRARSSLSCFYGNQVKRFPTHYRGFSHWRKFSGFASFRAIFRVCIDYALMYLWVKTYENNKTQNIWKNIYFCLYTLHMMSMLLKCLRHNWGKKQFSIHYRAGGFYFPSWITFQ